MNQIPNTNCLIELHYLPCIEYLSLFFKYSHVTLEKHEHYQKGSYRNRCYIGSQKGRQMLSVPLLKGKHQQLPITDVKIAYHAPWYANHWHAIETSYGRAPFFEHYSDVIRDILYQKHDKLWDLNMEMLKFLLKSVQAPASLGETTDYNKIAGYHVDDLRNTIKPDDHHPTEQYNQVLMDRMEFQHDLSALDLLMHLGPQAYYYMKDKMSKMSK